LEKEVAALLNGFKIRENSIPSLAYRFTLSFGEEDEGEKFRIIKGKYGGVPLSPVSSTLIEVASLEATSEGEPVPLFLLPQEKQEELVLLYLKRKLKVVRELQKSLPPPRVDRRNNVLIAPTVKRLTVKKLGEAFYLFFEVGFSVRSLKNIHQLVQDGKLSYRELEGKEVIYDPYGGESGERKLVKVVEVVTNPPEELVENLRSYLFSKYGFTADPSSSPVLRIRFKGDRGKVYETLPQTLFLDRVELLTNLVISNGKRRELLERMAGSIDFLEGRCMELSGKSYPKPLYLVRTERGEFKKVASLKETLKYPAFYAPREICSAPIPLFLFIDEELPQREVERFVKEQTARGYMRLNRNGNPFRFNLVRAPSSVSFKVSFKRFKLPQEVKKALGRSPFGFALCICREMKESEYDKAKRKLFAHNILSQFVVYDRWRNSPSFVSGNLTLNIYAKVGIRPFSLAEKLPYDFVVGIDVGNDRYNRRSKAGIVTVFLSNGLIKTMFPVWFDTGGEKIELLGELIELLTEKLELQGGRILILRDGIVHREELESLKTSLAEEELEVEVVSVKKNHSFRILSDKGPVAVLLDGGAGILLPHSVKGARSLLVDSFYSVKKGRIEKLPVTHSLLSVLYKLTKVNLSTIFREESLLRLPSPLHYCDRFVKSLGRNWQVSDSLLKIGCLYFI